LLAVEQGIEDEDIQIADDVQTMERSHPAGPSKAPAAKRITTGNMKSLSGADDMAYMEITRKRDRDKQMAATGTKLGFLKKYLGRK
jgi:hypothetical protein